MHSLTVWVVVALTIGLAIADRANPGARRAVVLLLGVELFQGAVGYAQYFLALPPWLVTLHMVGTALFTATLANLWWLTRAPASPALGGSEEQRVDRSSDEHDREVAVRQVEQAHRLQFRIDESPLRPDEQRDRLCEHRQAGDKRRRPGTASRCWPPATAAG